jgi:hypothetical protein
LKFISAESDKYLRKIVMAIYYISFRTVSPGHIVKCGGADNTSGGGATPLTCRQKVQQNFKEIISHLRFGTRPSWVGLISGLTLKMEQAFRSGLFLQKETFDGIDEYRIYFAKGGETIFTLPWTFLGMDENPKQPDRKLVYEIYQQWRAREVGFLADDLKAAQEIIKKELTEPYNITIVQASTAGEIYHVIEVLRLLPEKILRSGIIKEINLKAGREASSRFAQYDSERKVLGLMDHYSAWDRYLLTIWLLSSIGCAVHENLPSSKKEEVVRMAKSFWEKGLIFGTDYMGIERNKSIGLQSSADFFAENFMYYLILGETIRFGGDIDKPLRHALYSFYHKLLNPAAI